jgi:hypothetical protein
MLALAHVSALGIKSWQLNHLNLDKAKSESLQIKALYRLATIGSYLERFVQQC